MAARHTRWKGLHNSSVWRLRRPFILSQGRRKREEGEGKKRAGHEDRGKKGRGEEPTGAGKGKASREKGEKLRKSEAREEAGQGRRESGGEFLSNAHKALSSNPSITTKSKQTESTAIVLLSESAASTAAYEYALCWSMTARTRDPSSSGKRGRRSAQQVPGQPGLHVYQDLASKTTKQRTQTQR